MNTPVKELLKEYFQKNEDFSLNFYELLMLQFLFRFEGPWSIQMTPASVLTEKIVILMSAQGQVIFKSHRGDYFLVEVAKLVNEMFESIKKNDEFLYKTMQSRWKKDKENNLLGEADELLLKELASSLNYMILKCAELDQQNDLLRTNSKKEQG